MHNILVITNDLKMGGIQKSVINFLKYLVFRGFDIDLLIWENGILRNEIPIEVNVIMMAYPITWKKVKEEKGLLKKIKFFTKYVRFKYYATVRMKPWLYFPKTKNHYDVAVSYSQEGYPRFYAIDKISADKKYLWYHHGNYIQTNKTYSLDKEYYHKFANIITVSPANKKMLMNHFLNYGKKIIIVPNIVNVEEVLFKSKQPVFDLQKRVDELTFVTVSRFSKIKGLDLSIDVATELRNQGFKFKWYFIGEGATFEEIKNIVYQRNIADVCILLGNKLNPYPYMALADLYIQTSYVESQSITVLEALVLKKLIVTTDLPALREVLQNGKLGMLCKPEVNSFVEKISILLHNETVRNKIIEAVEQHSVSNEEAYKAINELF